MSRKDQIVDDRQMMAAYEKKGGAFEGASHGR